MIASCNLAQSFEKGGPEHRRYCVIQSRSHLCQRLRLRWSCARLRSSTVIDIEWHANGCWCLSVLRQPSTIECCIALQSSCLCLLMLPHLLPSQLLYALHISLRICKQQKWEDEHRCYSYAMYIELRASYKAILWTCFNPPLISQFLYLFGIFGVTPQRHSQ